MPVRLEVVRAARRGNTRIPVIEVAVLLVSLIYSIKVLLIADIIFAYDSNNITSIPNV